jgi:hypothetical protein
VPGLFSTSRNSRLHRMKSFALSLILAALFMAAGGFPPQPAQPLPVPVGNVTVIHKSPATLGAVDEGAIGLGIPHVIV